jgi:hypothetical protein
MDFLDDRGQNVVHTWINSLPKTAKARINTVVSRLEVMDRLERPLVRLLKGDCEGLFELRIPCQGVQYRPICCYGPGPKQVTILLGAIEKGSKFEPRSACSVALERKRVVLSGGDVADHDYR